MRGMQNADGMCGTLDRLAEAEAAEQQARRKEEERSKQKLAEIGIV